MNRLMTALLAAGLVLGGVPTLGFADEKTEKVEELSSAGAQAYRSGDFEKAIELFQKAYDLQPVPNLLFNIAKCYEKIENWDKAVENYEKFVVAPDVESEARQQAMDRIDALNKVVAAEKERKRQEELAAQEQQRQQEQQQQQQQQPPPEEPSADYTWAYVTLGTGIALLAGGGVFGLMASSQEGAFKTSDDVDVKRDARSKGRTFALVADSMMGAGAVATIIGIVLFATASPEEPAAEGSASLTGWIVPDGGGVGLTWTFE